MADLRESNALGRPRLLYIQLQHLRLDKRFFCIGIIALSGGCKIMNLTVYGTLAQRITSIHSDYA
eukprot:scaffold5592_cov123-Skeletonema_dohrnii-CCMP3373.AAC.1